MKAYNLKFKDYVKFFPPRHLTGLSYLPAEKWFDWQKELVVAEIVMQTLANKYGGSVSINYRDEWPQRSWKKIQGFRVIRISITLNNDEKTYVLSKFSYIGLLEFMFITKWWRSNETLGDLTKEQINDPDFMVNKLEEVIYL